MRYDAATILIGMGFDSERDFTANALEDGSVRIDWHSSLEMPSEDAINAAASDVLRYNKIVQIKTAARQIILSRLPEWKQQNMTARAIELVSSGQASGAEWDALNASWAWVKAVRMHSNTLESLAMNDSDVAIEGWPE